MSRRTAQAFRGALSMAAVAAPRPPTWARFNTARTLAYKSYYNESMCDPKAFERIASIELGTEDFQFTQVFEKNIPIYAAGALLPLLRSESSRQAVMAEWSRVLLSSSGVLVIKGACKHTGGAVDAATSVFQDIIEKEKEKGQGPADHFAQAGSNDRVWNSLQKLCLRDPEVFALYHGNEVIDAVCEAWLGPGYQMTAQLNVVKPGGQAQEAHRDYHLGFQTADICAQYPAHAHRLALALTLQGAVAHSDMPVASGPTKLLPFSQLYKPGYLAWRLPSFREVFERRCVQLPLEKGDAVFFNPALFHAAGANTTTDVHRMVNLLQVSSPFGRAMESVDRSRMSVAMYPAVRRLVANSALSPARLHAAVAACAEGYQFPTNLDTDAPVNGLASESQQGLFKRALAEDWDEERFSEAVAAQAAKRMA